MSSVVPFIIEINYKDLTKIITKIFNEIMTNQIAAVASGRAEFGPRALGNRSILADPRDPDIKDKVNNGSNVILIYL